MNLVKLHNFWSRWDFFCICWYQEKDILVLAEGPSQGLDAKTLTAEKIYSINSTENNKNFCLSVHYNETNSYSVANGKFKARDY